MSSEVTTTVVTNNCQDNRGQCICDPGCPACRRTVRCDCACNIKQVVTTNCQTNRGQCICDPDCSACGRTVRYDCVCKMKDQDPIRVPWYSKAHPMIPKLYVQPWTQDMVNRPIIYHNAKKGGIPTYEHDDALYLNKREQLKYNVQNRRDVDAKYQLPDRETMMCTAKDDPSNKYFSGMLARHSN